VIWDKGTLASGATVTDTLKVVSTAAGTKINVARVSSAAIDPDDADRRATASSTVSASDLSIVKTAPLSATAGDTIRYVLTLTNQGPNDAPGVQTRDTLPAQVTYLSSTGAPSVSGNVLIWTKGTVSAGVTVVDTVRALAAATGTAVNVARVGGGLSDPDTSDRRSAVSTTIVAADVSVTKTTPSPAQVAPGDTIVYVLSVANAGPGVATGVMLVDSLPPGVTFASATGGGVLDGDAVVWLKGSLASGAGTTDTLKVVADSEGEQTNVARVSSVTLDPASANDRATVTTTVTSAALSVSIDAPSSAPLLGTIRYVLRVRNEGPDDATSVTLVDSLPAGVLFQSASGGGQLSGNAVTWSKGTLASGAETFDTLQVSVVLLGTKTNVARVSSPTPAPDPAERRDVAETQITLLPASSGTAASATAPVAPTWTRPTERGSPGRPGRDARGDGPLLPYGGRGHARTTRVARP
jgi:uncharacterized repeat protein (TIGR01451 family)